MTLDPASDAKRVPAWNQRIATDRDSDRSDRHLCVFIMFLSILGNFLAGRLIEKYRERGKAKLFVSLAIVLNLALLCPETLQMRWPPTAVRFVKR